MNIVAKAIAKKFEEKGIKEVKLMSDNFSFIRTGETLIINGNLKLNELERIFNVL